MKFVIFKKKALLLGLALILIIVAAVVGTEVTGAAAIWNGKTTRKIPIYCVDTEANKVAISFDASWGAEKTLKILKIVEEFDIRANFFAVGFWAEKYAAELKALSDSGRFEIGTHSNTHPDMAKLSADKIRLELKASIDTIKGVTGKDIDLFRAPYGSYSDTLLNTAKDMGLYTIQWDVDSLDWKGLSSADMANRILSKAGKGSIILMHNDGEHTVEALPAIIQGIKNKGLEFTTIGELIYRENYTIDHTGKQIRSK